MRASTNIQIKERRTFTVDDMKGVDLYSSPLNVQANRASYLKNFVRKNGILEKRNGWLEIINLGVDRINGIYPYKNGDETELLIYCGKRFYRVYVGMDEEWTKQDLMNQYDDKYTVTSDELVDTRCSFFSQNGVIYIFGCGELLKYAYHYSYNEDTGEEINDWRLMKILAGDCYIPTTTISINSEKSVDTVRKTFEYVNLLSPMRRNKLLGESDDDNGGEHVWKLDASIDDNRLITVAVETAGKTFDLYERSDRRLYLYDSDEAIGSVDHKGGKITLNIDTTPLINGRDNITVTFSHTSSDYVTKRNWIKDCRFGTLFGVGGATDRVFLAGNEKLPNVEFFSEADDFTYWPDQYTATIGTEQSAIVGFLRLSDNSMAIFKESGSLEPTVFFQTGTYRESGTLGDIDYKITPVFSVTAGPITETAVNAYTCTNFSGDNLILSKNGVFALENAENLSTNVRLARERSLMINPRLTRSNDLKDASSISWRGKYYLSVDGECYVADCNYKTQPTDSNSVNYEWWIWDNVPARTFAIVEDSLWFGTQNGSICVFDDQYSDRGVYVTNPGELSLDYDSNTVTVDKELAKMIREESEFQILTNGFFDKYSNYISNIDEDWFYFNSLPYPMNEWEEVYLAVADGERAWITNGPFYIKQVNVPNKWIQLVDEIGNPVNPMGLIASNEPEGYLFVRSISNVACKVKNLVNGTFQLQYQNRVLDIISCDMPVLDPVTRERTGYLVNPTNPVVKFYAIKPVVAEWHTPVFNFGTMMHSKTLYKISISTAPSSRDVLRFGYDTRAVSKDYMMQGKRAFSFEDFSFLAFSFDSGFQSSYTVKAKEPNFNHIMFRFVSEGDSNCAINGFSLLYKINKQNIGVR